jgi:tetratricopeptide (TPR) repeat protein/V8-like Glu-specific endopeptidase
MEVKLFHRDSMLHHRGLGIVKIGTLASFLCPAVMVVSQQFADSTDPASISRAVKPLTVLIETEGENGSGVLIGRGNGRYQVLTAAHVLADRQKTYQITTAKDGQKHQLIASSIKSFSDNIDLATVEFTSSNNYKTAKLGNSDNAAEGSLAFVSGFPRTTLAITSSIYNFREGRVIANSAQPMAGGYAIIYSARTLPGMSGGGVFNEAGELIAIHGRGDIDSTAQADEVNPNVRFKTGNDLGIPINTFVKVAKKLSEPIVIAAQPPSTRSFSESSSTFVRGVGRARNRDHAGAIQEFTKSILVNHRFAAAFLNRGISKSEVGDDRGSLADQASSLELDPNQSIALLNRGVLRYRQGDKSGALKDYTAAIKLQPDDPIGYYNRAIVNAELQQSAAAVADYNKVIEYQPSFVAAYYNRGTLHMTLGNNGEAFTDFERVLELQPKHPQALLNRGNLKFKLGNGSGAVRDYSQAIAIKPDYALAYSNRASAHLLLRSTPRALEDLQKAAQLYQQQGNTTKYQEAIDLYRKLGGK